MKIRYWLEMNKPEHVESTVAGFCSAVQSTPVSIVTTVPGETKLYSRLCSSVPRVGFNAGFKTHAVLGENFASPEGWRDIQRAVMDAVWRTQTYVVVLDHETALATVLDGTQVIDHEELKDAIKGAHLPTNVTYEWYPGIGAWNTKMQGIARAVCVTAQEAIPDLGFLDGASLSGPKSRTWGPNVRAGEMLQELADKPPVPILYCYGPDEGWWQDDDLAEALHLVQDGEAILYPGHERWAEAAAGISERLIAGGHVERVWG